jgi:membrane fusion protein (multidrug efflux system)
VVLAQTPAGSSAEPPPVPVTVVTLVSQDVTLTATLPGRVVASAIAEVRPQVDGIIVERMFDEGTSVMVGDPLYRIDPASYEARVAEAKAHVAEAEAKLRAAQREFDRVSTLIERNVVSAQTADEIAAVRDTAEAGVAVANAALKAAEIDLERTTIRAPLSGVIGRSLTTQGALVTDGQAQPLAIIRRLDPVLVDVTQSAAEIVAWQRGVTADRLAGAELRVSLILADGAVYDKSGVLTAADPYVNEQTGVVTLRLEFANPNALLLPGMYVQVVMPQGIARNVIRAPQQGVSRDRRGRPVALVVNAEGVVEERPLKVIEARDADWLVSEGLHDGDRIIVEGLQKVRPGAKVVPEEKAPAAGRSSQ